MINADLNNYRFGACRALQHEWRHENERRPGEGAVGFVSICVACGCERVKWITRSGVVKSRYSYPDGYKVAKGEAPTPREWRSTYVASLFDDLPAHEGRAER